MEKSESQFKVPRNIEELNALTDVEFKNLFREDGFGWVNPKPLINAEHYQAGYEFSEAVKKRWAEIKAREQ